MADERIKKLHHQRGNIQGAITMFNTTLQKYGAQPVDQRIPEKLQAALDGLRERYKKFESIQDELEDLDPEREGPKRFEFDGLYDDAIGEAARYLKPIILTPIQQPTQPPGITIAPTTSSTTASLLSLMRLPKLDIPKFDGSYENWNPFWDSYECAIDKNPDLSKVQKLQYLRSLLTGRAAKAIESLSNTEDNYDAAVELMKKKYDCTRKIVRRHWDLLHEYPPLSRDTPEALGHLVDTVYQHTGALKNLGQPVDHWDLPLIHLIQSKISPETCYLWELKINDAKLPKYTNLLDFLENRSTCSSMIHSATRNEHSNRNLRGRQAFITTIATTAPLRGTGDTCIMCKDNHSIMKCTKFRQLSSLDRFKEAKKLDLCINCLTPGHTVTKCNSRCCSQCNKPHNDLLHR